MTKTVYIVEYSWDGVTRAFYLDEEEAIYEAQQRKREGFSVTCWKADLTELDYKGVPA